VKWSHERWAGLVEGCRGFERVPAGPGDAVQCGAARGSAGQRGGVRGGRGRLGAVLCRPYTGTLKRSLPVHCRQGGPHRATLSHSYDSPGETQALPLHCHRHCHGRARQGRVASRTAGRGRFLREISVPSKCPDACQEPSEVSGKGCAIDRRQEDPGGLEGLTYPLI
jgi:hypothetical protein